MLISLESIYRGDVTGPLKRIQAVEGKKKQPRECFLGADKQLCSLHLTVLRIPDVPQRELSDGSPVSHGTHVGFANMELSSCTRRS